MDENEKKELINKILNVDSDPKGSRVAATVFINKASSEDAKIFLDHLDSFNPAIKKVSRNILAQLAVQEALDPLIQEFYKVVGTLQFMPNEEYKESQFYPNLIELLETIFAISKTHFTKNDQFYERVTQIFKKTKNEDLRFTLIKILGLMGDQLNYFISIYDELTEKERRALYYVYTFVDDPQRMEIYDRGLNDDRNFEFVISNLMQFELGRKKLSEALSTLGSYKKQTLLKKIQETKTKSPEIKETLIHLLNDRNKFLVELSIENLKLYDEKELSMEPFIKMIESGYSPEGIQGSLEIISHFVKKNPEDIYLKGLEQQPSHKIKNLILEFFIEELKSNIEPTFELSDKVISKLLTFFENHSKEKEELIISIFKIFPSLKYENINNLRIIKKKVIKYKQDFEKRFSNTFKNNLAEFLVKNNQIMAKFEEAEAKLKNIKILFDIDPTKIDHERLLKLKQQLDSLDHLEEDMRQQLVQFLKTMYDVSKINWKIRAIAIEILGEYGNQLEIPYLSNIADLESSLAVKVNAQNALEKIEERYAEDILPVLILEPLFYLQKKLNEYFKSQGFKVFNLKEVDHFEEIIEKTFKFLVISDTLLNEQFLKKIYDYLDKNLDTILIIVTATPENLEFLQDIPNVRFLKKPFNDDLLNEAISEQ